MPGECESQENLCECQENLKERPEWGIWGFRSVPIFPEGYERAFAPRSLSMSPINWISDF